MAKFTSYDGIDSAGIRAEVVVQTGTGVIASLTPRGTKSANGSYRNIEVVFTPDNPKLIRKVYGMLDTTSTELWDYIQQAHKTQANVAFRIESQRRRTVDRSLPFKDLNHSEDVIRVIAAIDHVFSHEALTSPAEDPHGKAPSALDAPALSPVISAATPAKTSDLIAVIAQARNDGLPQGLIDALCAQACAQGASITEVMSAGLDTTPTLVPRPELREHRAIEERPWVLYNSDGRLNPGSYWVAHVASAHRFAVDYLHAENRSAGIEPGQLPAYTDRLASSILSVADTVGTSLLGYSFDRQKNSYNRILSLAMHTMTRREDVPLTAPADQWSAWVDGLTDEVRTHFIQIMRLAHTWLETSTSPATDSDRGPSSPEASASTETSGDNVLPMTTDTPEVSKVFQARPFPDAESQAFEIPSAETVDRLKALCQQAGVADQGSAVAGWLEKLTGQRSARRIHSPVLVALATHYEAVGSDQVAVEVGEVARRLAAQ